MVAPRGDTGEPPDLQNLRRFPTKLFSAKSDRRADACTNTAMCRLRVLELLVRPALRNAATAHEHHIEKPILGSSNKT